MSYRKSEIFEPPGKVGRKTGFYLTRTPRRNENGLEDLKDFFLSDDEYESPNNKSVNTSPNKRLSMRYEQLKSQRAPGSSPISHSKQPQSKGTRLILSSSEESPDPSDSEDADKIISAATRMGSPIKPNVRRRASLNGSPRSSQSRPASSPKKLQPSPLKKSLPTTEESVLHVDSEDKSEEDLRTKKSQPKSSAVSRKFAAVTKNMALQKKASNKGKVIISDDDESTDSSPKKKPRGKKSAPSESDESASEHGDVDEDEDFEEETDSGPEVVSVSEDTDKAEDKDIDASVEEVLPKEETPMSESGVRRSSRRRVSPVAWWRNEKIIYETTTENGTYVKKIKDVIHRPVAEPTRKRRQSSAPPLTKARRRSRTPKSEQTERAQPVTAPPQITEQPEKEKEQAIASELDGSDWLQQNSLTIPVFEGPGSENQIERTVAWAPNKSKNISIIKNSEEFFRIATLFDQDSEFSGGGIIEIPVGSRKAIKSNDDTYFIFFVIQGVLEVTLSHNPFVVVSGCSFEVPMGNFYQFDNKGKTVVKLFFVQSKYVVVSSPEDDDDEDDDESI
ncbi:hypothetical protein KL905_002818 [Ogataea polymorpha]|nr:hypothetical protein KL927_003092 [Ogataea polymorpha]KAG7921360.1 hypothetical protein KL905_002818 [Ogataea polymorpha]